MPEKNMLGKCCLDGVSKEPGSQLQHISPELCKYPYQPVPAEGLAQIFPTCSSFFSKSVCFFRGGVSCKASDEVQKWQVGFSGFHKAKLYFWVRHTFHFAVL